MQEHDYIKREVSESASTSEENREKTRQILDQTRKICSIMERKWYKKKADSMRKECEDVRLATYGSLKEESFSTSALLGDLRNDLRIWLDKQPINLREGEITDSELEVINQEFQDVQDLNKSLETSHKTIEELYGKQSNKKLWELSHSEAKHLLNLTQENYHNFEDIDKTQILLESTEYQDTNWMQETGQTLSKIGSFFWNSIDSNMKLSGISNQREYNIYQEGLINKIYGESTSKLGYSKANSVLLWYDIEKWGNYVIPIREFEQQVKNGEKIDPKSIASLINFHWATGDDLSFKINISKILWERSQDISTLLSTSQDSMVIQAKNKLIDVGIFKNNTFYDCFVDSMSILFWELLQIGRNSTDIKKLDYCMNAYKSVTKYRPNAKSQSGRNLPLEQSMFQISAIKKNIIKNSPDIDLKTLKNTELKSFILKERKNEFAIEWQKLNQEIQNNIGHLFQNAPDIQKEVFEFMDVTRSQDTSLEEFIQKLDHKIQLFNNKNPHKAIIFTKGQAFSLLQSINSAKKISIEIWLSTYIQTFHTTIKQVEIRSQQLGRIQKNIDTLTKKRQEILHKVMGESELAEVSRIDKKLLEYWINGRKYLQEIEIAEKKAQKQLQEIEIAKHIQDRINANQAHIAMISDQWESGIKNHVSTTLHDDNPFPEDIQKESTINEDKLWFSMVSRTIVELKKTPDWKKQQEILQQQQRYITQNISEKRQLLNNKDWKKLEEITQTELQQDNKKYESKDWKQDLHQTRYNYEQAMVLNYGKNWKEIVPLTPKDVPNEKRSPQESMTPNTENQRYTSLNWTIATYQNTPAIRTSQWEYISITHQEQKLAEENPEVLKNIIHVHDFCEELNMMWVWDYRKELCIAMNDMNINIYNDSLSEQELLRFGNNIAKLINGLQEDVKINNSCSSIFILKSELRTFTEAGVILSQEKAFNNLWEDKLTALLRQKWIIKDGILKHNAVKDILHA